MLGILTVGGYTAWARAPLSSQAYAERVEADCREIVVAAVKVWHQIEDKDLKPRSATTRPGDDRGLHRGRRRPPVVKGGEVKIHTMTCLLALLLLAGCTPHGRIGALPTIPNPTDAAEIVVIRERRFTGAAHTVSIILDGAPVYGINSNEHVIIPVPAGHHLMSAAAGWSESTTLVQAAAQQRYYFRVVTGLSGYGFRLELIARTSVRRSWRRRRGSRHEGRDCHARALKARQERDGVPVSVQIRRALDAALGTKPERKGDRP